MLADEDLGERVAALVQQLADAEEELGLPCERRRAPRGERLLRGLDGGVDLFDRGEVDRAGLPAGRGVVDRTAAPRRAVDAAPADPVWDPRDGGSFDRFGHAMILEAMIDLDELQLAARNHGMPLELLREPITPAGLHYLLIHFDIPHVDAETWRLEIGGLVRQPLELSLADLRARPARTLTVTLECAGNGRALDPGPHAEPAVAPRSRRNGRVDGNSARSDPRGGRGRGIARATSSSRVSTAASRARSSTTTSGASASTRRSATTSCSPTR